MHAAYSHNEEVIANRISLLLLLFLGACSPGSSPATQLPVQVAATDIPMTPSEILSTPTMEPSPTVTPEAE